jgi:hypothetical protein
LYENATIRVDSLHDKRSRRLSLVLEVVQQFHSFTFDGFDQFLTDLNDAIDLIVHFHSYERRRERRRERETKGYVVVLIHVLLEVGRTSFESESGRERERERESKVRRQTALGCVGGRSDDWCEDDICAKGGLGATPLITGAMSVS